MSSGRDVKLHTIKWALISSLLYGFCSGSMNFLNKFILSVWSFHQPGTIMFAQMAFLAMGLHILKYTGIVALSDYNMEKARIFIPLTTVYSINSVMSLSALTDMNIPMYNAIRRCVPIASLVLGLCTLRKQKLSPNIVLSVLIITAGTFIAAAGDMDFDVKGYFYGIASIISQALYLTTLQRLEMDHNIGALSISYINSINCLPAMALLVVLTGEVNFLMAYAHWNKPTFLISFTVLVLYGCLFTYSMFLCTTVNSALTTSLVGVAKSAITTIFGMYAFGGVTATAMMIIGQTVNLVGAAFYAFEKYRITFLKNNGPLRHSSELGQITESDSGRDEPTGSSAQRSPLEGTVKKLHETFEDDSKRAEVYKINGIAPHPYGRR